LLRCIYYLLNIIVLILPVFGFGLREQGHFADHRHYSFLSGL
jgi:hypothetical protein